MSMNKVILSFQNISAAYQNQFVLKDINLDINEGDILSIVGESGSGKSTLLNTILGINNKLVIPKGNLIFDDKDLVHLGQSQRRKLLGKEIAIIPQSPLSSFNPLRKLGKQFKEVCKSHNIKYDEEQIGELFAKFGLSDTKMILNSYPYDMSGGMIQRIAIAFMLLLRPKILLCDEITSALDFVSQKLVIEEILQINREFGVTVLFVTHDFGIAKSISDSIAFIDNGMLLQYGTPKDIFSNDSSSFVQHFMTSLYRLEDFTKSEESYEDSLNNARTLLEVRDLHKSYNHKIALNKVSFEVKQGEILGIVGESGSGKSTLLKAISGLLSYDGGNIDMNKVDISGMKPQQLGRYVQSIFQDPISSFDPSLTIRESFSIVEKNFSDKEGVSSEAKMILLKDVDLPLQLLDKYPRELSGGQCQRFAIARALISQPRLLLCDEITSSLDVISQRKVIDILKRLKEYYRLTILFVSHDLSVVANLCDRIMVIKDGEVVESGLTSQIISAPKTSYTQLLLDSTYRV